MQQQEINGERGKIHPFSIFLNMYINDFFMFSFFLSKEKIALNYFLLVIFFLPYSMKRNIPKFKAIQFKSMTIR